MDNMTVLSFLGGAILLFLYVARRRNRKLVR